MKIRLDHVTNSSSSSFIVARHKDCTQEEIKNMLVNKSDKLKNMLENCSDWFYFDDEEIKIALREENYDKALECTINEILSVLWNDRYYYDTELEIDGWKVMAGEASSDDGSFINYLFYDGILDDTEHLKVG